jgi:hypothetical protein
MPNTALCFTVLIFKLIINHILMLFHYIYYNLIVFFYWIRYNLHQADRLPRRPNESINEPVLYGSSLGSRSGQFGSDRNHHHSVSDGALSYMGSPAESLPPARWTPSVQRFDLGEFSTPAGGNKCYDFVWSLQSYIC